MPNPADFDFAGLPNWTLLQVDGIDALEFLQGQLTQDIKGLNGVQWRYAGYCNAKGRLLTTAFVWQAAPMQLFLAVPSNNADFVQKRLAMFVLRAKVKISPAPHSMQALGLLSAAAIAALAANDCQLASGSLTRLDDDQAGAAYLLNCSSPAAPRYLLWLPSGHRLWPIFAPHAASLADWQAAELQAGIAHVDAASREAFVPQMINFELIGGVNFQKGCYPGQEVVARSQYLGKLKRRMGIATVVGGAPIGTLDDVLMVGSAEPVGSVVSAVSDAASGQSWLTFTSTLTAQVEGQLHLVDGRPLDLQPLPYPITDITA